MTGLSASNNQVLPYKLFCGGTNGNGFRKFHDCSTTIIKDSSVFSSWFIPPQIPFREKQLELIPSLLENYQTIYLFGSAGTGKTTVARSIADGIKLSGLNTKFVYVNCDVNTTSYRVFYQVIRGLGIFVPRSGLSYNLFREKFHQAYSHNTQLVVILDGIENLKENRALKELMESGVKLVMIGRKKFNYNSSQIELNFPSYNESQLYSILRQRAELGLANNTWDDEVLHLIAKRVAQESGNARRAIDVLRIAAKLAESEDSEKITTEHVEPAFNLCYDEEIAAAVRILPMHHRLILAAIAKTLDSGFQKLRNTRKKRRNLRPGTGAIYSEYAKIAESRGLKPLGVRRVSGILRELETLGLIELKIDLGGAYGNTKVVTKYNVPPHILTSFL